MSFADQEAAVSREPIWLLELHMDQCSLLNPSIGTAVDSAQGEDECNATEECYYTWFNCEDTASYTKGTRIYKFINRGAFVLGARPLLLNFTHLPTKVRQDRFRSEIGEMRFRLVDTAASPLANPSKNIGDYSQLDSGRFWPNFLARNTTFRGRIAKLKQGYKGIPESEFEDYFVGIIHDIDWNKDGVEIIVRHMLWKAADNKFPGKIPTNVVVDDNPLAVDATVINLDDGTGSYDATVHFDDPQNNGDRTVKIEDEYIAYAAINVDSTGSQLTGCTRGAYGTTAAAHAQGSEISQVVVYAENADDEWENLEGVGADRIVLDLLCFYAKVDPEYIDVKDWEITLDGAIGPDPTTITLNTSADLSNEGVIKIGDEFIGYGALDGNDIVACHRGLCGTTPASHDDGADVYVSWATAAIGIWRSGLKFKGRFENAKSVGARIKTWSEDSFVDVWTNEDGKITGELQAPPLESSYPEFTEDDVIFNSMSFERDEESRVTRVNFWYDPRNPDPKTSGDEDGVEADYRFMQSHRDAEAEDERAYDEIKLKSFYGEWVYRRIDALWIAAHYMTKYFDGTPKATFGLELRENARKVLDLIRLTVPEDVDADGVAADKFYFITSKLRKAINYIEFIAEQAGFGDDKYAKIGPENGILDSAIGKTETTIDVDLSGTDLTVADFRTVGTDHQIIIGSEKISYINAVALATSYEVVRLSLCTRGVDGTVAAVHSAGDDVLMLYSGASDAHRATYGFIGSTGDPPAGNLLDGDGDFTEETTGYLIW